MGGTLVVPSILIYEGGLYMVETKPLSSSVQDFEATLLRNKDFSLPRYLPLSGLSAIGSWSPSNDGAGSLPSFSVSSSRFGSLSVSMFVPFFLLFGCRVMFRECFLASQSLRGLTTVRRQMLLVRGRSRGLW